MPGTSEQGERVDLPDEANPELAEAERVVRELPWFDWGQHEITRATVWTVASFAALWWSGWLNPWWALLVFPCALYALLKNKSRAARRRSPDSAA